MNTIELEAFKTVPDIIYEYSAQIKRNQTPLIIDNGTSTINSLESICVG